MVNGALARQLAVDELAEALQKGGVAPAQASKARHAVAACRAGVPRVHVINGRVDEGLLAEVFSNEGIGTLVYANEYRQIRRARKRDVRSIQQLIQASVESEELLPRSRAAIERQLDDYYLYEVDRNPVACVALHVVPEQKKARAGLPVRAADRTRTRASAGAWSQFVEDRAREVGLETLLRALHPGLQLLPVEGRLRGGRRRTTCPPARREKLRAERPAVKSPPEDATLATAARAAGFTPDARAGVQGGAP